MIVSIPIRVEDVRQRSWLVDVPEVPLGEIVALVQACPSARFLLLNGLQFVSTLPNDGKHPFIHVDHVDVAGFKYGGVFFVGLVGEDGFSDVRITNSTVRENGDSGDFHEPETHARTNSPGKVGLR